MSVLPPSSDAPDVHANGPNQAEQRDDHAAAMAQVRSAIDTLDAQLVALLAERLGWIRQAAQIKTAVDEARVPWRIEDVALKVRGHAERVGFDPDAAERIWRAMMEECIAFEERRLAARNDQS